MNISDINDSRIEAPLKALLEEILFFLENFIEDQNDLKVVEQQLKDYDNLVGLVSIIANLFKTLTKKIDKKISLLKFNVNDNSSYRSLRPEEEYEKLEAIIQRHEAEIRNHISLEQQMKLYTESLQQKLEENEQHYKEQMDNAKTQQSLLKKESAKLSEVCKHINKENDTLRQTIEQLERKFIVHTEGEAQPKSKKQALTNSSSLSEQKLRKVGDYSSEYPTTSQVITKSYPQSTLRHSTPLKSQSQHNKALKQAHHRNSTQQDQDLFYKYGQMLRQQAASITQRSQLIQSTQFLHKNNQMMNLSIVQKQDLCSSQQLKPSQRSKSQQGNSSKLLTNNHSSNKLQASKIIAESSKTNEAIQKLLKLK